MNDMNKNDLKEKVVDYADKVFFYCVKRCNSRMDAEDLSQTILLEIIQNIDKGARIDNMDYYVWGVCKNQYNIYLRKTIKDRNNIELNDDIDEKADSISALDEMLEDEKVRRMNQAIKLLSKDYTQILYAYYVEDKTLKFISEELNMPLGTVKKRLFTIRQKLKEYLDMEKLNGKKAYVPKNFHGIMANEGELDFNPDYETSPLLIKNLLFHSYDNPCSLEDYSIELGISIAYIEDYIRGLVEKEFLIKQENGKYLTNIAFVDKTTKRKIFDLVRENIDIIQKPIIEFCKKNIEYYRSLLLNDVKNDELLMWSLIYIVEVAMRKSESGKRTKKCENGSWDFCMAELTTDHEYDEYFISHNIASVDEYSAKLVAWPSSVDNPNFKVGYRTSWNNAANARENYRFLSTILDKQLKYSELDEETKAFVDEYKNKNYLKIENDIVEIVPPIISESNFSKLYSFIKNDINLQKALNEYSTIVYREVEKLFPAYLHKQIEFIVAAFTNTERSLIINYAYNQGLLSLDEENEYFVYNMVIVKK